MYAADRLGVSVLEGIHHKSFEEEDMDFFKTNREVVGHSVHPCSKSA